jgi:hypothetical protein
MALLSFGQTIQRMDMSFVPRDAPVFAPAMLVADAVNVRHTLTLLEVSDIKQVSY